MKKIVLVILACFSLLIVSMLAKTVTLSSRQMSIEATPDISIDRQRAAQRLSRAVRLKTVSHQDTAQTDTAAFRALHELLREMFPMTHRHLKREVVNNLSLLYTWQGSRGGIKPIMLLAHLDVAPVADGTLNDWTHPPFEGQIADGFVWGRGTMDNKLGVMGILEAVEALMAEGFEPERTIYLAFGHDEEVGGGKQGASKIADLLKSRHVSAEWILDEGGLILSGAMPGLDRPVALPGIAEKGYVTLELSVQTAGGHSSMPPARTAIGILANAVANLEQNPFPASYDGIPANMFAYIAPEMPFGMKFLFSNSWLLSPLIKSQLQKVPSMNAMLRTTIAPTVIQAGIKENVLPQKARALVNFRIYPGDTLDDVLSHVKKAVDDPAVRIEPTHRGHNDASPVTDTDSEHFRNLQKTIHQVFPDAIVAPFLMVAGTDTKNYTGLSDNIFRFLPLRVTNEDLKRIHGTNERVDSEDYEKLIQFYAQVIRNAS